MRKNYVPFVAWTGAAYAAGGPVITVRDFTDPGFWRGDSGHQGWAIEMADRGDYEIIWMERLAERIEGTLDGDIASGTAAQADATVTDFYRGLDPGTTVTVHDTLDRFSSAVADAKFQATWDDADNQYVLTWCELPARNIRFTLDDFLETSDASISVTVTHFSDGQDPGATLTVYNQPVEGEVDTYIFEGDDGATGLAYFDPENNKYWMFWVQCPTQAVPE